MVKIINAKNVMKHVLNAMANLTVNVNSIIIKNFINNFLIFNRY